MYEDFMEIYPDNRKRAELGVNFLESGRVNINSKLRKEIGDRNIRFKYGKKGMAILILPCNSNEGFKINKAGSFKCQQMLKEFRQNKMSFPIHYNVELKEDVYYGEVSYTYSKIQQKK